MTKSYLKDLTYQINGAAIEVHKSLGPGLLETVYHKCLNHELHIRGLRFTSEMRIPVYYKGIDINTDLKCDLIVEGVICLELKSVETILPIHEAQLITYMNLLQVPKGILLNFNVASLYAEGQKTFVNELYRKLAD